MTRWGDMCLTCILELPTLRTGPGVVAGVDVEGMLLKHEGSGWRLWVHEETGCVITESRGNSKEYMTTGWGYYLPRETNEYCDCMEDT